MSLKFQKTQLQQHYNETCITISLIINAIEFVLHNYSL